MSRTENNTWRQLCCFRPGQIAVRHVIVMTVFIVSILSAGFGPTLIHTFAHATCQNGDRAYTVLGGDTLANIATRNNTTWQKLANHNTIANANMIYVDQTLCIPTSPQMQEQAQRSGKAGDLANVNHTAATRGANNTFPYGQCTWWASQRYFEIHGVYVPWNINSNAWQWYSRANQFNWHVSASPMVGAIVVLQPGVQGAFDLGHVAVVEQILPNGHVTASNMNWAGSGSTVVNVDFTPGSGVSFVTL